MAGDARAISAATIEVNARNRLGRGSGKGAGVVEEIEHARDPNTKTSSESRHVGPKITIGDLKGRLHDGAIGTENRRHGGIRVGIEKSGAIFDDGDKVSVLQPCHVTTKARDLDVVRSCWRRRIGQPTKSRIQGLAARRLCERGCVERGNLNTAITPTRT